MNTEQKFDLVNQQFGIIYDAIKNTQADVNSLSANTSATAKLTILENGNVGIGTTAPTFPLDVNGSAKFTTIVDNTGSVGTSGQVLSSTGSALSWITSSAPAVQMAILREMTAFGVASTISFPTTTPPTPQARVSRNINDIQYNTLGITVSAPNFTIPTSGTYQIIAKANFTITWSNPSNNTGSGKSRLYLRNETSMIDEVIIGDTCWGEQQQYDINNLVQPCQGVATLTGVFTNSGSKTYSIQQIVEQVFRYGNVPGTKFGGSPISSATTNPEYYVNVCITKIA